MSDDRRIASIALGLMSRDPSRDECERQFFAIVAKLLDDPKPAEATERCDSFPAVMGVKSAFRCEKPKGHSGPCYGSGRSWVPA